MHVPHDCPHVLRRATELLTISVCVCGGFPGQLFKKSLKNTQMDIIKA